MPVTVVPHLVTWYVTAAPGQKRKAGVTRAPSVGNLRKSGVRRAGAIVAAAPASKPSRRLPSLAVW
jgi:hypothetical protein